MRGFDTQSLGAFEQVETCGGGRVGMALDDCGGERLTFGPAVEQTWLELTSGQSVRPGGDNRAFASDTR